MPNRKRQQKLCLIHFKNHKKLQYRIAILIKSAPKYRDSIESGDKHIVPAASRKNSDDLPLGFCGEMRRYDIDNCLFQLYQSVVTHPLWRHECRTSDKSSAPVRTWCHGQNFQMSFLANFDSLRCNVTLSMKLKHFSTFSAPTC